MDIGHWIENTGEPRARKRASAVRRRAGGKGLCKQYLACCLSYFSITGTSKELLEKDVKPLVEQFLRERGLQLSAEKTVITHIEKGFDFLGQNVRKYQAGKQHKLLLKPSKKNVQTFLEKVRTTVKANKALTAAKLIIKLNPMIRGWTNYHQHVVSKETFSAVDDATYRVIRQWIKRKHPRKTNEWIAKQYCKTTSGNNWVLTGLLDERQLIFPRFDGVVECGKASLEKRRS